MKIEIQINTTYYRESLYIIDNNMDGTDNPANIFNHVDFCLCLKSDLNRSKKDIYYEWVTLYSKNKIHTNNNYKIIYYRLL
jgi:hypothetical protein